MALLGEADTPIACKLVSLLIAVTKLVVIEFNVSVAWTV